RPSRHKSEQHSAPPAQISPHPLHAPLDPESEPAAPRPSSAPPSAPSSAPSKVAPSRSIAPAAPPLAAASPPPAPDDEPLGGPPPMDMYVGEESALESHEMTSACMVTAMIVPQYSAAP